MNESMMKKLAPFLVMLAGILWGTMGLFVRRFNDWGLASMQIVELRSLLAMALLLLGLLVCNRRLLRIRLGDWWCFLGTGVLSMTFFNYCYFSTIQALSLSVAATLLYTSPIFVMLLSAIVFRERITRKKILCLLLAFSGCVLVSGVLQGGASLSFTGILLGLGSGFGYALYSIFSRIALNRGYHSLTITFYTFVFSSIGGAFLTDFGQIAQAFAGRSAGSWFLFVFYVLLTTVLAYIVYTLGMSRLETSRAAVIAAVEPVAATLFGLFFFQEIPTLLMICGMVSVLAALVLLSTNPQKGKAGLRTTATPR